MKLSILLVVIFVWLSEELVGAEPCKYGKLACPDDKTCEEPKFTDQSLSCPLGYVFNFQDGQNKQRSDLASIKCNGSDKWIYKESPDNSSNFKELDHVNATCAADHEKNNDGVSDGVKAVVIILIVIIVLGVGVTAAVLLLGKKNNSQGGKDKKKKGGLYGSLKNMRRGGREAVKRSPTRQGKQTRSLPTSEVPTDPEDATPAGGDIYPHRRPTPSSTKMSKEKHHHKSPMNSRKATAIPKETPKKKKKRVVRQNRARSPNSDMPPDDNDSGPERDPPLKDTRGDVAKLLRSNIKKNGEILVKNNVIRPSDEEVCFTEGGLKTNEEYRVRGLTVTEQEPSTQQDMSTALECENKESGDPLAANELIPGIPPQATPTAVAETPAESPGPIAPTPGSTVHTPSHSDPKRSGPKKIKKNKKSKIKARNKSVAKTMATQQTRDSSKRGHTRGSPKRGSYTRDSPKRGRTEKTRASSED